MRTFAQKQNQPQKQASSGLVRPHQATPGPRHREHSLLHLQRTIGNRAVLRMLQTSGKSNEQADAAPGSVDQVLASPGSPLEPAIRQDMEQRFGHDFSKVRVHTDAKAAASAQRVNAQAYSVGQDVVFSERGYTPRSRHGAKLLAHELTHVVQQERGGVSPPSLSGGALEQDADAAAATFDAGSESIHVRGASAPGLARQPLPGAESPSFAKPRSLAQSLLKDEQHLDDAALKREIELIEDWLAAHPSSAESHELRSELKALYQEELRRMEEREDKGQGPKPGSAKQLLSIVHRGRLQVALGLWPGSKFLAKGTMEWQLGEPQSDGPFTTRSIQVRFTPNPSFRSKKVTFIQTVHQVMDDGTDFERKQVDKRGEEFDPFYGGDWDPKQKQWIPEVQAPPQGYKNQPSSSSDPAAYLWDQPSTREPVTKVFETVAVVPETGETLGALRWSVGKKATPVECTDNVTAGFLVAVDTFYSTPTELGRDRAYQAVYDEVLDGFGANDATLTAEQQTRLDAIATKAKSESRCVAVGGFGDAIERDPMGASEQRAQAVARYLIGKGLQQESITTTGFGATWARFQVGTEEVRAGRNRRVQIRLRSPAVCNAQPGTGVFH